MHKKLLYVIFCVNTKRHSAITIKIRNILTHKTQRVGVLVNEWLHFSTFNWIYFDTSIAWFHSIDNRHTVNNIDRNAMTWLLKNGKTKQNITNNNKHRYYCQLSKKVISCAALDANHSRILFFPVVLDQSTWLNHAKWDSVRLLFNNTDTLE